VLKTIDLEGFEINLVRASLPLLPVSVSEIAAFQEHYPKAIITEEQEVITFAMFYDQYGYRVGKVKAEAAWNKLNATEQRLAVDYISRYRFQLHAHTGQAMLHPATYLNQKRWID
jgi:hypothetical protein